MTNRSVSPLRVCPPTGATDFRQRIINLVAKHDPTKLQTLGVALQHFRGKEDRLLSSLVSRLGAEPTPQEVQSLSQSGTNNVSPPRSPASASLTPSNRAMLSPAQVQDLRRRIVNMYRKYNPARLGEVNTVLSAINGREDQALQMLIKKCGPEPTPEELTRLPPVPGTGTSSTPTPASRPLSPVPIRQRIMNMLIKYDRDKLSKMEQALETYRGREPQILKSLVQRYGPEPTPAEIAVLQRAQATTTGSNYDAYRTRVSNMLRRYNPAKLGTEDTILGMYKGKEEELLRSMVAKYGPEPSVLGTAPQSLQSSPGQSPITIHINPMGTPHQASLSQSPANPSLATPARQTLDVTSVNAYSETKVVETQQPCALNVAPRLFRSRVGDMYIKYAPEKLKELNHDVLSNTGREETFLRELVQRYGAEPTEQEILGMISTQGNFRSRVQNLYRVYKPDQLASLDGVLASHRGKEAELIRSLLHTCGPDSGLPLSTRKLTPGSQKNYRHRVKEMYILYDPDMLATLEMVLKQYDGREDVLLSELIRAYGPEAPKCADASESVLDKGVYRERVRAYFQKYENNTLDADVFLQLYDGREEEMMSVLEARYGKLTTPESMASYRRKVLEYYTKYDPSLVPRVDDTLAQFAGKEDQLLEALRKRYASSVLGDSKEPLEKRIRGMYEKYDPSKLPMLTHILQKYKGTEDQLLEKLIATHGPEPQSVSKPPVVTSPQRTVPAIELETKPTAPQTAVVTKPKQEEPTDLLSQIIASRTRGAHGDWKMRLIHMFMRYDPDRLPCVDSLLAQNVGSEEEMMRHLVSVYGAEPSVGDVAWFIYLNSPQEQGAAKGDHSRVDLRTCLTKFFLRYDPSLLGMMENMFGTYTTQFEERVQSLFASTMIPSSAADSQRAKPPTPGASTTSNAQKKPGLHTYRRRVRNFFTKYDASRLGSEDDVLAAHTGREEEMMASFVRFYGPEPTDCEVTVTKQYNKHQYKRRIYNLLTKYDPSQLDTMDSLLTAFDGAEDELMRHLVIKYGSEPTDQERRAELANQRKANVQTAEPDTRTRLINFLDKYAPSRLSEVDGLIEIFKGQEQELFRELASLYGAEPTESEVLALARVKHATSSGASASGTISPVLSNTPLSVSPCPAPYGQTPTPMIQRTTVSETRCNSNVVSVTNMRIAQPTTPPTAPSAPPTSGMDYRTRISNFFTKYDPGNLPLIDEIMEAYEGSEESLLQEMFLRYGPEPSNAEVAEILRSAWVAYYRERLKELYEKHDPERLPNVDVDLQKYSGHEAELLETLTFLYTDIAMRNEAGESVAL